MSLRTRLMLRMAIHQDSLSNDALKEQSIYDHKHIDVNQEICKNNSTSFTENEMVSQIDYLPAPATSNKERNSGESSCNCSIISDTTDSMQSNVSQEESIRQIINVGSVLLNSENHIKKIASPSSNECLRIENYNDSYYFNMEESTNYNDASHQNRSCTMQLRNTTLLQNLGSNSDSTDDSRDRDFDIEGESSSSSELSDTNNMKDYDEEGHTDKQIRCQAITNSEKIKPLSNKLRHQQKKNYRNKPVSCKFCDEDVTSRNFVRHLSRKHNQEKEVQNILKFPVKCKERKHALSLLRNESNFNLYLRGTIRPKKQVEKEETEYYPCVFCKAIYTKTFLKRHAKTCAQQKALTDNRKFKTNYLSLSQTAVACALDPTGAVSKLDVKEQVFNMMRGDEISFVGKKDILIAHYGESYLKSQKRERKEYSCSNKIREMARLLIAYRAIVNDPTISFKDLLLPENFDKVVVATRNVSGYDPINKTFQSPSIAMHMGTSLKAISDELIHLILKGSKGFQCNSPDESQSWRRNIKNFKKLVESKWNTEISSVANKDLNEKRWQKPLLVPLISDVKIFREEALKFAKDCEKQFLAKTDTDVTYKLLVQCSLSLLILFNRRRIGDVQYLKINAYRSERRTSFQDFEEALSESEKVLTQHYKRVVNGGKGSRAVVILVPQLLQHFLNILLENRYKYIPADNQYVFALPNSKLKWAQGDVAIRNLANKMKLENSTAISSNKLRKHIATTMQVLTMSKNDCKQFSKFMGHTEKTHEEFYELPIDIYQTARVVKVLLMMEKGVPSEFKGKSLSEIEINVDEYAEGSVTDKPLTPNKNPSFTSVEHNDELNTTLAEECNRNELNKDNSTDNHTLTSKKRSQTVNKRQGWTTKEINLLKEHFKRFISNGTYPSGSEINDFIKTTNSGRSVPVVRSKIQHLIKQKN